MNVLCHIKAIFVDFSNLQSNKQQKKETQRSSYQHFAQMHLFKREISIPTRNLESFSYFLHDYTNTLACFGPFAPSNFELNNS